MQQNTCTIVCWSTSCNIWHPTKDLGSCYCDMHPTMEQLSSMHQQWIHILPCQRHLCECSVKATDTVPSGTTATLQALTRPHFLVAQPASPPPAPHMQPTSAAPASLATQMKQAPAVPTTPAVQRNAPAPMPVTSHATPVQPWRSGHACMAPRCLIQEIKELLTWTFHGPCYCYALPHTSPVNCFAMYHNLRKGDVAWLYHITFRFKNCSCYTSRSVDQSSFHSTYI